MDVDDPAGLGDAVAEGLSRLDDAREAGEVSDEDHRLIRRFIDERGPELAASSAKSYCDWLRRAMTVWDGCSLAELGEREYLALRGQLDRADVTEATRNNYLSAVRTWARWYHDEDPFGDLSWDSDTSGEDLDPGVVLEAADIKALRQAAHRTRDVAIIEFLADTGVRRTLAASLRIRDVDFESNPPTFSPNPDAQGLKGAPTRSMPLIDSPAPIRTYLRTSHPRPDDPDAPLFHAVPGYGNKPEGGWEGGEGALSSDYIRRRLTKIGDRAGLDKPTNPHHFRHSAISRMLREGFSREEIAHRVCWSDAESEMFQQYSHVSSEQLTRDIARKAGVEVDGETPDRTRETCGNCFETVAPHHDHCPRCGHPVSREAVEAATEAADVGLDALVDSGLTPEQRRAVAAMLRRTGTHGEDPSSTTSS